MDNRAEVREFLLSRRSKITPQQAGLPDAGHRRVPGLRRGEVAALAGVSVEYYAKLERGSLGGVSASVLDALARALQLDDAERAHLFHLAQAADGTSAGMRPRRRPSARWTPRPALQWVLDGITPPAIIRNGRMDLLATNHLGWAMHASLYDSQPGDPPNFARYTFLDDDSHRFYPAWDTAADTCMAILRTEAGRDPYDKALHDLVGELSTRSSEFRQRWSAHDVRLHGAGTKHFHHTTVGNLELAYEKRRHDLRPRSHHDHLRRRTRITNRTRARPARLVEQRCDKQRRTPRHIDDLSEQDPTRCDLRSRSEPAAKLRSWSSRDLGSLQRKNRSAHIKAFHLSTGSRPT